MVNGRLSTSAERNIWSSMDEFVLSSLVGKVSYRDIAIRLGRTPSSVQRKASEMGLSARRSWSADRRTRQGQLERLQEARLRASEEELADYI